MTFVVVTLHLPMAAHVAADVLMAVVNALAGHDLDGVLDVDQDGRPVITTARPSGGLSDPDTARSTA